MENRIKIIYAELYVAPSTKQHLANLIGVTTKTIENTVKKYSDEILYDKKLGAYRFANLLPKFIPYKSFFGLVQNNIVNEIIKDDFSNIMKLNSLESETSFPFIPTSSFSNLTKKLIMIQNAINSNCVLKIGYVGNSKPFEEKYIHPHTIITTEFTHYLYASYDSRNGKAIGEERSFAFKSISEIEPLEYIKGGEFQIIKNGNAYGIYNKDQCIKLKLETLSANYFKREGLFKKENFDFISEDPDGSVLLKMYFNEIFEIVNLLQKWMPQITINENSETAEKVYEIIERNYAVFVQHQ